MNKMLRHNSRHHLWFPQGYKGRWAPRLNPIESTYDRKFRPRFNEPMWLFKLRQRLFCYAGRQHCGRRGESHLGATGRLNPDTWDMGPDGNRTCSYCGSIHFDDLMTICRKTIVDERYSVDGTTKSYKVYVRQPGVRNAGEGAIKFYSAHLPKVMRVADRQLLANAMKVSFERYRAKFTGY